ncbi:flagellar hook-associated protein FlgK [Natroniella sulfidigena]|uniref:flagellar hook-associated protein FlgK n=1 Tax=Natroniella sulfidigena TaxID=723921 RepID=UPI00200A4E84|nr:flagellar hook-associated protein FlgK [Natroniella sulfidigena]MCK8816033.1 flagellar hook-associated protein FlgK [Natroniella sulfidigena]
MSTFGGIELGKRALQTNQKSLEVTGHNIANANNEAYSRQNAVQKATRPHTIPGMDSGGSVGQQGTGVEIASIERARDQFIDERIRQESGSSGYWEMKQEGLEEVEMILSEPSEQGLQEAADEFWNSLQELSGEPESKAVRATVRQKSMVLTDTFNHYDQQLDEYQRSVNSRIGNKVDEINSYGERIADLNQEIRSIESSGQKANDLRDERDHLIEGLSKITNVHTKEDAENNVMVSIGGSKLVWGDQANEMEFEVDDDDVTQSEIRWKNTGNPAQFQTGEIQGLLEVRDEEMVKYQGELDKLASGLVKEMNQIHGDGYGLDGSTGVDFFSGNTAGDIQVSEEIQAEDGLNKIAASADGAVGDGNNALEMSKIASEQIYDDGNADFNDFYKSIVSEVGVDSQRAERMIENQDQVMSQLEQQRTKISGVSLDEEMSEMIKFQHGYNSAAKVVSTMNEMLEVLVNGLIR